MDEAVKLVELTEKFVTLVKGTLLPGRRFDRVTVGDSTKFFIEKDTQKVFGAKSSFQYNPRREFGTLSQMDQMNWDTLKPITGTALDLEQTARENSIKSTYKQRGRPRKNPTP